MNTAQYEILLLRTAVATMASDGEIHDDEVEEMLSIAESTVYFSNMDVEQEMKGVLKQYKMEHVSAIRDLLDDIKTAELKDHQALSMIDVIIRIIKADSEIKTSEIAYLRRIMEILEIPYERVIAKHSYMLTHLVGIDDPGSGDMEYKT